MAGELAPPEPPNYHQKGYKHIIVNMGLCYSSLLLFVPPKHFLCWSLVSSLFCSITETVTIKVNFLSKFSLFT